MCLHPVVIPNPRFGLHPAPGSPDSLYDCTSQYLNVPCGHCPQCIAVRQMSLVQRVYMESLENHLFFATLTYNNNFLPKICTSTGFDIPYADIHDLQNCFKRINKYGRFPRPWSYLAVSERGSKYGRPHFHVLFSVRKYPGDTYMDCLNLESIMFDALLLEWRRNVAPYVFSPKTGRWRPNTRSPIYQPLCTYFRKFVSGKLSYNFDLHWCDPYSSTNGLADISFYVSKYMLKPSSKEVRLQQALRLNLDSDEYEEIWPIVRSGCFKSHFYGDNPSAVKYIRDCIDKSFRSGQEYPCFINPLSGQMFPLARYYSNNGKYYPFKKALQFYYRSSSDSIDTIHDSDKKTLDQYNKSISDYEKVLSKTAVDRLDAILSAE